jgi:hypothetical protein
MLAKAAIPFATYRLENLRKRARFTASERCQTKLARVVFYHTPNRRICQINPAAKIKKYENPDATAVGVLIAKGEDHTSSSQGASRSLLHLMPRLPNAQHLAGEYNIRIG